MGLELVRLVSQCAGAVAVLALIGCFLAATIAVELSRAMIETADDASSSSGGWRFWEVQR